MNEDKKSYYAIIPATVRYNPKLTANAKLLYGEITALCNEKGYCWASNSYFAKLYGVSNQAISAWIKSLQKSGYVNIEYDREGQQITRRKVSINIDRVSTKVDGGINKCLRGYQQKFKENITFNTTINNKEETDAKAESIHDTGITELGCELKKKPSTTIEHSKTMSQALQLASLLLHKSREFDPKLHRGKDKAVTQRWARDIEKLIRIDGRSFTDIETVIRWVKTEGNFWLPNIMSGKKLREKFPQLFAEIHNRRTEIASTQLERF